MGKHFCDLSTCFAKHHEACYYSRVEAGGWVVTWVPSVTGKEEKARVFYTHTQRNLCACELIPQFCHERHWFACSVVCCGTAERWPGPGSAEACG